MINADGTGNEQIVSFSGPGRFSPDGRGVAFVKDGNVQVIDLRTRAVRVLTTDGDALYSAPDWSPDGRRLVYAAADSFRIVPATGGPSTGPDVPGFPHSVTRPVFSPDARHVAFSAYETVSDPDTYLRRLYVSAPDGSGLTAIAETYEEPTDWLG